MEVPSISEPSSLPTGMEPPSSKLSVTVTPVQELVHASSVDTTVNACHALPLFGTGNPHREYQIRITEESGSTTTCSSSSSSTDDECGDNKKKNNVLNNILQQSWSDHQNNGNLGGGGPPLCIHAQLRFSTFRKHFTSYPMQHLTRNSRLLIPPKGAIWEEYTYSMDNVSERARRMQLFLWDVLNSNGPEILRSHLLQEALSLSPGDKQGLLRIAMQREMEERTRHKEIQARKQEASDKKKDAAQKAFLEEKQLWNLVQTLDMSNPEARRSIRFQPLFYSPMQFEFYRRWFTFGANNNVLGGRAGNNNNKQTWFRLERTDFPQMSPIGDLTYQLRTTKGVPLLEMKERFRMMDYLCDLYYVMPNGQKVPALTVQRQFQLAGLAGGESFDVVGRGPLAKTKFECQASGFGVAIHMDGWFAGKLEQHFHSLAGGHTLTIAPNQDCLLVLGIACAVVRIHAARES